MTKTFLPSLATGPLSTVELAIIVRWIAEREARILGLAEPDANHAEFLGRRMAHWGRRLRAGITRPSSEELPMTDAKQPTAEQAYETAHETAVSLLVTIREYLQDLMAVDNEKFPIGWDDVATINEVNRKLRKVVTFLERSEA